MSTASYSSENLLRFLAMAADKGLMNKNTALAIRNASGKILDILEDHERIDVRSIDRERVFQRFQNLNGMRYSPESLASYRSRFTTALDEFVAYTTNPSAYKPQGRKGGPSKKLQAGTQARVKKTKPSKASHEGGGTSLVPVSASAVADSLMIPVPIREGAMVRIFGIPTDLTIDEAKKISAVIQAYAVG
jgi:hypothetical protein